MKRALWLMAWVTVALPLAAWPQGAAPVPGVQTLVYFAEQRPYLLRLYVTREGKPFPTAWDAYLRRLFTLLDRDGDGVLSEAEAARAPRPQNLARQMRSEFGEEPANAAMMARRTPELEVSLVGGQVRLEGLATFYRLAGLESFALDFRDESNLGGRASEALFELLDRDQDGAVSPEEMARGLQALHALDLDDDETVAVDELLPPADPEEGPRRPAMSMSYTPASSALIQAVNPADGGAALAQQLLTRYDKDKDHKLTRSEWALPGAALDQLDANGDGTLSAQELAGWVALAPDLELLVQFGGPGHRSRVHGLHGAAPPGGVTVRRLADEGLLLEAGDTRLEWRVGNEGEGSAEAFREMALAEFDRLDPAKRGYLEEGQVGQGAIPRDGFRLADGNSDTRLTRAELKAFLDVQSAGMASLAVLNARVQGRGFFDALDANNDGRLGPRELREAWNRLAAFDRNGDGKVAREELPRRVSLQLTQGYPTPTARAGDNAPGTPRLLPAPQRGPLWFRKMDRNGDGDVSRGEWLGTREAFASLDTDGDGFVGADEAARFEARSRKPADGK